MLALRTVYPPSWDGFQGLPGLCVAWATAGQALQNLSPKQTAFSEFACAYLRVLA